MTGNVVLSGVVVVGVVVEIVNEEAVVSGVLDQTVVIFGQTVEISCVVMLFFLLFALVLKIRLDAL